MDRLLCAVDVRALGLNVTTFAFLMMAFCHVVYIVTWSMVLEFCEGNTSKHVLPLTEEELAKANDSDCEEF
ncbi:hypothetical protein HK096_008302 [Nowakowskiella sp. JEL0078]|nr:hypothetical protein HK096_008302 [Nowakowskiella sp. JEL0078]